MTRERKPHERWTGPWEWALETAHRFDGSPYLFHWRRTVACSCCGHEMTVFGETRLEHSHKRASVAPVVRSPETEPVERCTTAEEAENETEGLQ